MLMKLSSWVTTNEKPRVGSYSCHSTLHGVKNKNFIAMIFGVWIFGLLQCVSSSLHPQPSRGAMWPCCCILHQCGSSQQEHGQRKDPLPQQQHSQPGWPQGFTRSKCKPISGHSMAKDGLHLSVEPYMAVQKLCIFRMVLQ